MPATDSNLLIRLRQTLSLERGNVDPDDTLENWLAMQFGWDGVEITDGGDVRYTLKPDRGEWHLVTAAQFAEIMKLYHELEPWAPDRRAVIR